MVIRLRCCYKCTDEIVLEVPKSELAAMKKLVKQTMEEAIQLQCSPLSQMRNEGQPGTRLNKKGASPPFFSRIMQAFSKYAILMKRRISMSQEFINPSDG